MPTYPGLGEGIDFDERRVDAGQRYGVEASPGQTPE